MNKYQWDAPPPSGAVPAQKTLALPLSQLSAEKPGGVLGDALTNAEAMVIRCNMKCTCGIGAEFLQLRQINLIY